MSHGLLVRYAGTAYLDRTQALATGEVVASGIRLEFRPTRFGTDTVAALEDGVELAEVPLADALLRTAAGDDRFVALPVFPARSLPFHFVRSTDTTLVGPEELAEAAASIRPGDQTVAIWLKAICERAFGVVLPRWPIGTDGRLLVSSQPEPGLRAAFASPTTIDRAAYDRAGILPILSVLLLRRDLYERERWAAVSLVDAFSEAKALGNARLRYFGALGVMLPWLQRSLDEIDGRFAGDAFPYGLARNADVLSCFAEYAVVAGLVPENFDFTELFAQETRSHPGVPEVSFYSVPLSRV